MPSAPTVVGLQFERVYARPAVRPTHRRVGVSIFREEMNAPMTNPLARHDSAVAICQPKREGPMLMRGICGMQEETKKPERSCMAPVTATVSNFFSRAYGAFHRKPAESSFKIYSPPQRPQYPPEQPPVELEELTNYHHPGCYDSIYARPLPPRIPPPVATLHRSNAVRRTHPPMPARQLAVRRPTRDNILFPGAADGGLGHHPGGEADSYYLPHGTQNVRWARHPTRADSPGLFPQQRARGPVMQNPWEQQRLASGEILSVPPPTGCKKPLPPLPAAEPTRPLRTSHGVPRHPQPSCSTNTLSSLATMPGLPEPMQRSNYLLWRNMGSMLTEHHSDAESLSSDYDTYATTSAEVSSSSIPEAISPDRCISLSSNFSVGSSLHDEQPTDNNYDAELAAVPAQHRFLLSDDEDESEGEAVRMMLRVVNAESREEVEGIVRDQTTLDTENCSSASDEANGPEPADRYASQISEGSWTTQRHDKAIQDTATALHAQHQRDAAEQVARNEFAAELGWVPVICPPIAPVQSFSGSVTVSLPETSSENAETLQLTQTASDNSLQLTTIGSDNSEGEDTIADLANWDLYEECAESIQDVPGTARPDSPVLPSSPPAITSSHHNTPVPSPHSSHSSGSYQADTDILTEFYMLADEERHEDFLEESDTEPLIDQSLFADFDASPASTDLFTAYENIAKDILVEPSSSIDILHPQPCHPRAQTPTQDHLVQPTHHNGTCEYQTELASLRARNLSWEGHVKPESRGEQEWIADEEQMPTVEFLQDAIWRVNEGEEGREEGREERKSMGKFLIFYKMRTGWSF